MPVFINLHMYVGLSKCVCQQVKGKEGRKVERDLLTLIQRAESEVVATLNL